MDEVKVERPDHPGVVAGVIEDSEIIKMIDARIPGDEQENVTTGEAIAAMDKLIEKLKYHKLDLFFRLFRQMSISVFFDSITG